MTHLDTEIQRLLSSTSQRARVQYELPELASEEEVDAAIQQHLTTKHGLPIDASYEQIAAKIHEARCATFGMDPATTTEEELDERSASLTRKLAA